MKGLTERQIEVLDFLADFVRDNGYQPSIREIGKGIGVKSLRGVTVHLDALQKKGYLVRGASCRSIVILKCHREAPGRQRMPILKREDWLLLRDLVPWAYDLPVDKDDLDERTARILAFIDAQVGKEKSPD